MRSIYQKHNRKTGFTLIELLVVIAIIGLLSTLAVVALNSARQKARDAKRVADIKQVQTALELYFNENSGYPPSPPGRLDLGELVSAPNEGCGTLDGDPCTCLDQSGFQAKADCGSGNDVIFMGLVPANPHPPDDKPYVYIGRNEGADCTDGACIRYTLTFELEGSIPSLGAGTSCTATQDGVTCI